MAVSKKKMPILRSKYTQAAIFTWVFLALLALGRPVKAGSASGVLGVSAVVPRSCNLSATPLAFGTYEPLDIHSTSSLEGGATVTITCTKGTNTSIGLGIGGNAPGSGTIRAMADGRNKLSYEIYRDPSRTKIWGDTSGNLLDTGPASSFAPQSFGVYGLIPAGQDVPPGSYTDAIVVTVNF